MTRAFSSVGCSILRPTASPASRTWTATAISSNSCPKSRRKEISSAAGACRCIMSAATSSSRWDKAARMNADFTRRMAEFRHGQTVHDGVLDSHTAVMIDDYADRPGWKGEPRFDQPTSIASAGRPTSGTPDCSACDRRWAVSNVLDSYDAARRANGAPRQPPSHRAISKWCAGAISTVWWTSR